MKDAWDEAIKAEDNSCNRLTTSILLTPGQLLTKNNNQESIIKKVGAVTGG